VGRSGLPARGKKGSVPGRNLLNNNKVEFLDSTRGGPQTLLTLRLRRGPTIPLDPQRGMKIIVKSVVQRGGRVALSRKEDRFHNFDLVADSCVEDGGETYGIRIKRRAPVPNFCGNNSPQEKRGTRQGDQKTLRWGEESCPIPGKDRSNRKGVDHSVGKYLLSSRGKNDLN